MASYKHLTIGQRERLYLARNKGESMDMIAAGLGVSKSTVSRELKRNGGLKDYSPLICTEILRDAEVRMPSEAHP